MNRDIPNRKWHNTVLALATIVSCQIGCVYPVLPGPSQPQRPPELAAITGDITDAADQPVAGATIEYQKKDTGAKKKTKTNERGEYRLLLTSGSYTVTIEAEGFEEKTDQLLLSPFSLTKTLNFQLSESSAARVTGYDFLLPRRNEDPGYGLYSYVLFRDAPGKEDHKLRELYLAVIKACLEKMPTIEKLRQDFDKKHLNITYLPVKVRLSRNATAASVLSQYDFARARVLLSRFGKDSQSAGPYLVSSLQPLSSSDDIPHQYLWQDLTSGEPALVKLWISEFTKQASLSNFWEPSQRDQIILEFREFIARGAVELGQTIRAALEFKDMLQKLIEWREEKKENGH